MRTISFVSGLKYVRYESVPDEIPQQKVTTLKFLPVFVVILLVYGVIWFKFDEYDDNLALMIISVIGVAFSFVAIPLSLIRVFEVKKNNKNKKIRDQEIAEIKNINSGIREQHDKNVKKANQLALAFQDETKMYMKSRSEINSLLKKLYDMNILPSQYRTIPALHYIYEYMSTSQATFEDTLMHEHMENGIQRLERKLDQIIDRLEDVLYETRMLRGDVQGLARQNERIILQNQNMISHLREIQTNSKDAAMYAELGANYSKVNAFFSGANYFNTYAYLRNHY